jgi:Patatin-like phospholipase
MQNVGGVMSEDLFAYSNTGEPKSIVKEFIREVVTSLHWLAIEAAKVSLGEAATSPPLPASDSWLDLQSLGQKQVYEEILQQTVREEKEKLWKSLITSTLTLFGDGAESPNRANAGTDDSAPNSSIEKTKESESLSVFHRLEVLSFLKRARAAYGRTALCLSGGAMMGEEMPQNRPESSTERELNDFAFLFLGLYHFGHVLGLLEAGVLPDIISGTSGGSVIAAVVCTRTDDEIRRDFDPEILITKLTCFSRSWPERLTSLWRTGNLFSFEDWLEKIQWYAERVSSLLCAVFT